MNSNIKIENEKLKMIIDDILGYYFNANTRMQYITSVQKQMISQNRGLVNAIESIIRFAKDKDELVEYIKTKIEEINQGEAQNINWNGGANIK